ncbi:MAG: hypothetical protein ACJ76F_02310 [Bacteroidia bacterium]
MKDLYLRLPELPEKVNAITVLVRMTDALGFRYRWAVEGLTERNIAFRPVESSMDLKQVLEHIHFLVSRFRLCFTGKNDHANCPGDSQLIIKETLEMIYSTRELILLMDEEELAACNITRPNGEKASFWYFINGPLADALTHVGQITTWRRIMGNPVLKSNPFLGLPPEGY